MKPPPTPKPFVRSAHYEALRTLRRTEPARYISMTNGAKAALELYCEMRRAHESRQRVESRREKIRERGAHCACCGDIFYPALTLDHIKPKSQGGQADPANIQVLCFTCNQLKADGAECPHVAEVRRLTGLLNAA